MHHIFRIRISIVVACCISLLVSAQLLANGLPETFSNRVYQSDIRSIVLARAGFEISDPIIELNGGQLLECNFDQLAHNYTRYYYTVIHCNADWKKSEIWTNEYLEGYEEMPIEHYENSFNTLTPYIHYSFSFPNDQLRITKSGNYILRVYKKDRNENVIPVFDKQFYVVETMVSVGADIRRAGTSANFDTKQEVGFSIYKKDYRIDSPNTDIKVVVMQNGRTDNALTTLKPFMASYNELNYRFSDNSNTFDGGNEFRNFDIKTLHANTQWVRNINYNDTAYFVRLRENDRRVFNPYIAESDIDGRFLLKTDDQNSVSNEGEYAWVKFTLWYDAPLLDGDLYIGGAFNGWQFTPENKLTYNYNRKAYEAVMLLKQGYYNYQYIFMPKNSAKGDATLIDGNHSETRNTYTILVYHRPRGEVYDKLISVGNFQSK